MGAMYTIIIPGIPIAKKRHRMASGRSYSPQTEEERAVQWEIKRQLPHGFELLTGPLLVSVNAYFPRPKGHYGSGRNAGNLKPSSPGAWAILFDCDNIAKFYLDCMNGVVFHDDRQVVSLRVVKQYGVSGFVSVSVSES